MLRFNTKAERLHLGLPFAAVVEFAAANLPVRFCGVQVAVRKARV